MTYKDKASYVSSPLCTTCWRKIWPPETHVLQPCAVCCSVLQRVAVCHKALPCVAVCCSVLPCVAVCCSVVQCVAVCCGVNDWPPWSRFSTRDLRQIGRSSSRLRAQWCTPTCNAENTYVCKHTCVSIYAYMYTCMMVARHRNCVLRDAHWNAMRKVWMNTKVYSYTFV